MEKKTMDGQLHAYTETKTLGASQLDLILQVYDGAINAYRSAKKSFESEQNETGRDQLEKGKKFLMHLYTTLNNDKGGDIAENLGKLYVFAMNQTDVVMGTKDQKQIDEIIGILSNLREGWFGLKEVNPPQSKKVAQPTKKTIVTTA
jgi:flagellar protein FliS